MASAPTTSSTSTVAPDCSILRTVLVKSLTPKGVYSSPTTRPPAASAAVRTASFILRGHT